MRYIQGPSTMLNTLIGGSQMDQSEGWESPDQRGIWILPNNHIA